MIQRTTRWAIAVLALCLATACDDGDDATADGTDAAVEGGGGAGGDMPADGAGGSGGNGSGGSGTGGEADPYADWPEDPTTVFPYVYTPDPDAPDHAFTRWETEDWELGDPESALYLRKVVNHYETASPDVVEHFATASESITPPGDDAPGDITLSIVGDILWIEDNYANFADGVAPLTAADLRIANLETVASSEHEPGSSGLPVRFNVPQDMLDNLPFDVLQLNNNHTIDMDDLGAESTKAACEERGYTTTGMDTHATETVGDADVALLSYTWGLNRRDITSSHELFVVPFGHIDTDVDLSRIAADIQSARDGGADFVVLLLHWGFEFEHYPDPHFMEMAREMVAMGADVVAGHGPHVVQPAEICYVNHPDRVPGIGTCSVRTEDGVPRTAAVLYSLGNFTNDVPDRPAIETGIIAHVTLRPGDDGARDVAGMTWTPTTLRWDPVRVEPLADHLGEADLAEESARLDAHIGASWRRD